MFHYSRHNQHNKIIAEQFKDRQERTAAETAWKLSFWRSYAITHQKICRTRPTGTVNKCQLLYNSVSLHQTHAVYCLVHYRHDLNKPKFHGSSFSVESLSHPRGHAWHNKDATRNSRVSGEDVTRMARRNCSCGTQAILHSHLIWAQYLAKNNWTIWAHYLEPKWIQREDSAQPYLAGD